MRYLRFRNGVSLPGQFTGALALDLDKEYLFRDCLRVLCCVALLPEFVIQSPIGETCVRQYLRLVFASKDDAARQLILVRTIVARRFSVLFHITQVHTPDLCPKDEGGSNSLFDPDVKEIKVIGRYGANAQHAMFYIVEADDVDAIQQFLFPGFTRCASTITPVSETPVPRD